MEIFGHVDVWVKSQFDDHGQSTIDFVRTALQLGETKVL